MNYKIFRLKLVIYTLMVIAGSIATIYFLIASSFWLISGWAFLFLATSSFLLIREAEKGKHELTNFINAITFGEFKNTYKTRVKNDDLAKAFNDLIKVYRNLSIEKERNYLYLKTIIEHINIAILCFDEEENIVILNEAAKSFFNRVFILNMEVIGRFDPGLAEIIGKIKGGQKKLYKFIRSGINYDVSVHATVFKIQDSPFKLVSIQDVKYELEEQELDSWRKLVRVLTHEIMNTAIPISTLAGVTNQLLYDDTGTEKAWGSLNEEDQSDLKHSLKTIEKRSKGLVEFVKATKSYTNMPMPKLEKTNLKQMVENIVSLLKPGIDEKNIKLVLKSDGIIPDLNLDAKLIEQVIINIVKNSLEALEKTKDGEITISLIQLNTGNKIELEIKDNGPGMNREMLENAFVPFYTTKKEGSGIGLSLSRQIMRVHGGEIQLISTPDKGTIVKLLFNIL